MKKFYILKIIFCYAMLVSNLFSQQTKQPDWKAYNFLLGDWVGEGSGAPGEGTGTITFYLALKDQILIRKNHTEYPATVGKPAFVHDDVLIHYFENNLVRAVYFDSEGHTIHYTSNFSHDSTALILIGDISKDAPRFRFTYQKIEGGKLKLIFEIAPPGKPEAFSKYLEGTVKKIK